MITPDSSTLGAYKEALCTFGEHDWSQCEIAASEIDKIKEAGVKLAEKDSAIGQLRKRLFDLNRGFAIWDMSRITEADDENWYRRVLVLIATTLGRPFGAFTKHGFWKRIGVNVNVAPSKVEGTGFIPLHQDFVNARLPPDIVLYRTIRSDPKGGGASIISNIGKGIAALSSDDKEILRLERLYEGAYHDLNGLGGELKPFPVLENRGDIQNVRFTGKGLCDMADSPLKLAMIRLEEFLRQEAVLHQLLRGQTLFINQHIVCHGREELGVPVTSGFDARYLEQAFVRCDPSPWES